MEERKQKEVEWANFRYSLEDEDVELKEKYESNKKFYSVTRKSREFVEKWVQNECKDKVVFEMGCGKGGYSLSAGKVAKRVVAVDISDVSIQKATETAKQLNLSHNEYYCLDCENTGLESKSFDMAVEGGVLHHLDVDKAYAEAARLLKPNGTFLCVEAIRHNPIIHLYRKLTPHLRTKWESEHILGRKQVRQGLKYFEKMDIRFYHMATLFAVPFRRFSCFNGFLKICEKIDSFLVKIPGLRWWSWQAVIIFSQPKSAEQTT